MVTYMLYHKLTTTKYIVMSYVMQYVKKRKNFSGFVLAELSNDRSITIIVTFLLVVTNIENTEFCSKIRVR